MLPYNIPWPIYPKKYARHDKFPNVYRDEVRRSLSKVDFANTDYCHQTDASKRSRKSEELTGGLSNPLVLPWNYPPMTEDEQILEHIHACEVDEPQFVPNFPLGDKRYHIRLTAGRRQPHLPLVMPIITMPSDAGNLANAIHNTFTLPDFAFLRDAQQGLKVWFNATWRDDSQFTSIFVHPSSLNLRFVSTDMKDSIIRHLAKTIKRQTNLEKFTFENAFLGRSDAVRVLTAVALGAGETLKNVYFCNLFISQLLPIETESEYLDVYNKFEYNPDDIPNYSDEMKSEIWKAFIEQGSFDELTASKADYYFKISLRSFSNLTVLMVNYTWLSKGNGLYLLYLESIRNGKMRKLILCLTPSQHPDHSKQIISYEAWAEAMKMCPELELHFILSYKNAFDPCRNAAHMDFTKVFARNMPLASVHLSSVYPVGGLNKRKPWFFSYTTRFLWSYFGRTLRMITLEVWLPTTRVDVSMTNLILKCHFLQVFVYRGHIDKLDTIHAICRLLLENNIMSSLLLLKFKGLRKIAFHVADDPCRPEGWTEALEKTKEQFLVPLALRGVTLHLSLWKL